MSAGVNNIFSTGNTNFAQRLAAPNPLTAMANVAAATQPADPQTNMIWVDGLDAVLDHVRTPNETLFFGDQNDKIFYMRETDGNGEIKNPIHGFRYEEFEIPFGQEAKFVTKAEFQELCQAFNSMNGKFDQVMATMTQKLDQLMPTNLGGSES